VLGFPVDLRDFIGSIMRQLFSMLRRYLPLLIATVLWMPAKARAVDPAEMFLRAYQEFQAGERDEREGQLRDALNRYATAAKTLENIQRTDPEWQKMVVEYRLRKSQENLERLRYSVSEAQLAKVVVADPLPTGGFDIDIPEPMVSTRSSAGRSVAVPPGEGGEVSLKLQSQLAEARRQIQSLKTDLEKNRGELTGAKAEIDRTKTSLVEAKSELAQTKANLENVSTERDQLKKSGGQASDKRLADLTARIEQLEADNEVLNDENKRLGDKLDKAGKYIEASKQALAANDEDRQNLAAERDEARASLKKIEDNKNELARLVQELEKKFAAEKQALEKQIADQKPKLDLVAKLETENKDLTARLEEAELALNDASKVQADQNLLDSLREEITLLKDRLTAARSELHARDENIKNLYTQLDEASGELARLRLDPKPSEEQKRLAEENDLLKNIVLRQLKDQNERSVAVGILEQELEKLYVKSDKLSTQLAVLSKPPTKFTDREMLIFRDPLVVLNDPGELDMSVSMTVSKNADGIIETPEKAPQGPEAFSPEARQLIEKASGLVRERRFTDAEKIYQNLTGEYPDNHFALSNLAVTLIHAGKLNEALVALQKALRIAPGDVFASVNISNVYCRQGRFDEAVEVLKEVIKKDPQNAVAHNYLAIALGKQGNNKEAEDYFQRSILLDGKYSNAHFNLAVMYANTEPPSIELARKHYDIAKSLGSEPDAIMERRLAHIPASAVKDAEQRK
jgi:Flp pilus assembly protein TadD